MCHVHTTGPDPSTLTPSVTASLLGYEYTLYSQPYTAEAAQAVCRRGGANLASIGSDEVDWGVFLAFYQTITQNCAIKATLPVRCVRSALVICCFGALMLLLTGAAACWCSARGAGLCVFAAVGSLFTRQLNVHLHACI